MATPTFPLVFRILEMTEAEAVMSLCPIGVGQFGYSLANGIVGVYSGEQRMWRIKV